MPKVKNQLLNELLISAPRCKDSGIWHGKILGKLKINDFHWIHPRIEVVAMQDQLPFQYLERSSTPRETEQPRPDSMKWTLGFFFFFGFVFLIISCVEGG